MSRNARGHARRLLSGGCCLAALTTGITGTTAAAASGAQVVNASLNDVACTSARNCMAVGWDLRQPTGGSVYFTLAEAWNGSTWTVIPTPTPRHPGGGAELNAISCVSSTDCMAVGETLVFLTKTGRTVEHPIAEEWNGSTWTTVPTPLFAHSSAILDGISCTSTSSCMAVGSEGFPRNPTEFTLAESWNGTAWSFVPTPQPLTPGGTALTQVSCTGAGACMAVGYFGYSGGFGTSLTLAETWNGTSWRHVGTPTPGNSGDLGGVSCASATACTATGEHDTPNRATMVRATLAEQWNGSRWQARPSPNPRGAGAAGLGGVSCTGPASCMAVGGGVDQTGESGFSIAEQWNGTTWALLRTPSPGSTNNELRGVSCTSASSCMAVGDFTGIGNEHTLAEAWNGTKWTVVATPRP